MVLERGRATDACRAFEEAATAAREGAAETLAWDASVWCAVAWTDAAQFTRAEALCAAAVDAPPNPARAAWAGAVRMRLRVWQQRFGDLPVVDATPAVVGGLDTVPRAMVVAAAVRRLLLEGRIFEAGQCARASLEEGVVSQSGASEWPGQTAIAGTIVSTAHLRVLCATGDLHLARARLEEVIGLAREARAPLRAARARLIWASALHRAGRTREAEREWRRLGRAAIALSPLLRAAISERRPGDRTEPDIVERSQSFDGGCALGGSQPPECHAWPSPADVRVTHDEAVDIEAVRAVMTSLAAALGSGRVDLVLVDPRARARQGRASRPAEGLVLSRSLMAPLVTIGSGDVPRFEERPWAHAAHVGPVNRGSGWDITVPVGLGVEPLAVLVARWDGARPAPGAVAALELASALVAPRVGMLAAACAHPGTASQDVPELIGRSAAMDRVREAVTRAARAPFAVLIEGESGVGKELVARAVHRLSARRGRPFGDVNCAALPDELIDAELFGHTRGAFTGAVADRAGLFEAADGGTVFLDEVVDLSSRAQAKLLRVLQQQEVRRVGETGSRRIDVRVVSAANRDLRGAARAGLFRHDLLYRLDVIRVEIPPLRERPEDVPVLAAGLWRVCAEKTGSKAALTPGVFAALGRHHWPGNVRELQNVIAALAVAAPAEGVVRAAHVAEVIGRAAWAPVPIGESRAAFERAAVADAVARASGSHARAAQALGLSRQGLAKMCARLRLSGEGRG
jgi:DNA-binding NtrC family response regulator